MNLRELYFRKILVSILRFLHSSKQLQGFYRYYKEAFTVEIKFNLKIAKST